ncbi:MAG: hypothetical protein Q4B40_03655 [Clostridia bacterium]|nr:hypothetical protein [Clostridia bacterium]
MGFNKNKGISAVVVLIAFGVFNAIAFLIPLAHTLTFWLGYGFAALAAAVLIACFIFLFGSDSNEQSFLRVPLVKLAWGYFIIQMLVSVLEILGIIPIYLIALIINCFISGFYIIAMLASQAAGELIEEQDNKVAEKIYFLKNMQNLLSKVKSTDTEIVAKIKALSEDFKFSDPMTHSKLNDIENEIESKILALKSETDNKKIIEGIEEISDLLIERNEQCKLYKNVKEEKKTEDTKGVKYVATVLGVFALTAVVAITVLYYVVPKGIYNDGIALYGAQKYEEAIVVFEGLNGFGDSKKMIENCN